MAVISSTPGTLVVLRESGARGIVRVRGGAGRLPSTHVLITQLGLSHTTNTQFTMTLLDAVYAYSFGDNMGTIALGGKIFFNTCTGGLGTRGIDAVFNVYAKNRASMTGSPLIVSIGSYTFKGLLTGLQTNVADAEHKIMNFSYRIDTLP